MKKDQWKEEEISEDYCFTCKDGGHLRVCDFKKCLKAYHPNCVGKDDLFLEDDDHWTCGLHTCSCGKNSAFQCFGCPTSFCQSCIKSAEFVQVKKNKGFCINCLRLAKMIEENRQVDSDGDEVDFSNTETVEFLFKDYWEIVKDKEGLSLVDVQAADARLKRGENFQNESDSENFQNESDSEKLLDEESMSGPDDWEDDIDDGKSLFKGLQGKRGRKKTQIKKSRKERVFIGWASEQLITFLASIGKNTKVPLGQVDVAEIVKEYVQSKNLFQSNKKRKNLVVSDEKLRYLFRKKKLKYHKIFDLVKSHLAEEQSDSIDEFPLSSEDDKGMSFAKKRRMSTNSDYKNPRLEINDYRKKVLESSRSCYAAIIADNIKLAYLKRSLMHELIKDPEAFGDKVVGCFVRVRNDPKDFYFLVQKAYQLGQVTGIKKTEQEYKIGEMSTDIVLQVSNFSKDIKISMLSDDDVEEEECEDLRQLVKKGLFRQPTIAELERKIKSVHEDIVNHWINREILKLQKQIDRANEKGWRRELHEYIDKREMLRTAEERLRLVEEIPEVIPDTSDEAKVDRPLNLQGVNKDASAATVEHSAEEPKGNGAAYSDNAAEGKSRGARASSVEVPVKEVEAGKGDISSETNDVEVEGVIGDSCMRRPVNLESELNSNISENDVLEIKDEEHPRNPETPVIEIIDLEDDDDDNVMLNVSKENNPATTNGTPESREAIWCYTDPAGNEQGPFTLASLRNWKEFGYFDDDFKIWKSGEREGDGILLAAALASADLHSQ